MPIQGETTGSKALNGWMDFPTMRSILLSKFGESNSLPIIGSFSDSSVHRIDPCMPYGSADASNMVQGEQPSFYNWRTDAEAIKKAMAWPLEGLLFDVEQNNLWLDSWGVRPSDAEGRQERVSELVSKAPSLVPVISHRYLLGTPVKAGNPVLSVYQSDIIIYGSNFRNFLTADLSDLLGLDHEEAYRRAIEGVPFSSIISIPFWGEIIGK